MYGCNAGPNLYIHSTTVLCNNQIRRVQSITYVCSVLKKQSIRKLQEHGLKLLRGILGRMIFLLLISLDAGGY